MLIEQIYDESVTGFESFESSGKKIFFVLPDQGLRNVAVSGRVEMTELHL